MGEYKNINHTKRDFNLVELNSSKPPILSHDTFEDDESDLSSFDPSEVIELEPKSLSDYHLFALLCWRNFANLPEMTLIESVQRVLSPGDRKTSQVLIKKDNQLIKQRMTSLERRVAKGDEIKNGVLWCVTKLFTNEHNFNGRHLMYHYLTRDEC